MNIEERIKEMGKKVSKEMRPEYIVSTLELLLFLFKKDPKLLLDDNLFERSLKYLADEYKLFIEDVE